MGRLASRMFAVIWLAALTACATGGAERRDGRKSDDGSASSRGERALASDSQPACPFSGPSAERICLQRDCLYDAESDDCWDAVAYYCRAYADDPGCGESGLTGVASAPRPPGG